MSKALAAITPYGPPFALERAWESDDTDDGWSLVALRDGFTDVLESAVKIAERDYELAEPAHPHSEVTHFRSNRLPIDGDLADHVMAMDLEEIEKQAQWRRDNAEQLTAYPRAVLDAFAKDITYAVEAAGEWDRKTAERWRAHREAVAEPVNRWLERLGADQWAQPAWSKDD